MDAHCCCCLCRLERYGIGTEHTCMQQRQLAAQGHLGADYHSEYRQSRAEIHQFSPISRNLHLPLLGSFSLCQLLLRPRYTHASGFAGRRRSRSWPSDGNGDIHLLGLLDRCLLSLLLLLLGFLLLLGSRPGSLLLHLLFLLLCLEPLLFCRLQLDLLGWRSVQALTWRCLPRTAGQAKVCASILNLLWHVFGVSGRQRLQP